MILQSFDLIRLQIPLQVRFSQSNNSTDHSDSVILQLQTTSGKTGHGEACPRPYVSGETARSVARDLNRFLPLLLQQNLDSLEAVLAVLETVPEDWGPASRCALELALLDAWGQEAGLPVADVLGGQIAGEFSFSGVCPLSDPSQTAHLLSRLKHIGFAEVKLKLGPDLAANLATIRQAKAILGPDTRLRADLNCAWGLHEAQEQLPHLIAQGISNVEQMFLPEQTTAYQMITREFGQEIRITIDEGLTTPASARRLMEAGIGNQLNLKISKHGGILPTLQICELASLYGYGVQLGAHFGETSLLTSAGLVVASMCPHLSSLEGAFGQHLLTEDLCEHPLQFGAGGRLWLSSRQQLTSGLGVTVKQERLYRYAQPISAQAA